jgi:3-dehydroquinate dehydratase-2
MMIAIINGPNLNLLGSREPEVYGSATFETVLKSLRANFPEVEFQYFQSNVEGELINALHRYGTGEQTVAGIVINPGGYAHTSVALADAISSIGVPVVEVHISNIFSREDYRHVSLTASKCLGSISGFGVYGYELAVHALQKAQA